MHDEGITPVMSRNANCWDNTAMELFFSRLKVEDVFAQSDENLDEVYSSVFEYIELFYNRVRKYLANGYSSPAEYEKYSYEEYA